MLNLADHDSMIGKHVASGKLEIWPLAIPENQGFIQLPKFPREGKDLGKSIA
jgi:hypothetical protein